MTGKGDLLNLNLGVGRTETSRITILPSRDRIFEMEVNTEEAKLKIEN